MRKTAIAYFLILFLMSKSAVSGIVIEPCFQQKKECAINEIEDYRHNCRSCLTAETIHLGSCRDEEDIKKTCPNRTFLGKCSSISILSDQTCLENELMGDDGKCYSCDASEGFFAFCIGKDNLQKKCPNRFFLPSGYSVRECPEDYTPKGKRCVWKCPKGSKGENAEDGCFDEKTGEKFVIFDEI